MTIKAVAQTILVAASIAIIPANLVGGAIQGQLGQSVHAAEIKNPQPEYGRIQNIPYLSAPSAAIYDYTAHSFVYSKQPFSWQYSASTSKLMAMYAIYRQMKAHPWLKWSSPVKIDYWGISRMSVTPALGETPLVLGRAYSAQQLAQNAMILSSNESITALGRWAFGSNQAMINAMNWNARRLGLNQTRYYTTSGLDVADVARFNLQLAGAPYYGRNTTSAYDLVMLAQALFNEFPQILQLSSMSYEWFNGVRRYSTDHYLPFGAYYNPKHGIDGLKTGTTPAAGQVFVGTSVLPGHHRIITVVLHSRDRYADTNRLLGAIGR